MKQRSFSRNTCLYERLFRSEQGHWRLSVWTLRGLFSHLPRCKPMLRCGQRIHSLLVSCVNIPALCFPPESYPFGLQEPFGVQPSLRRLHQDGIAMRRLPHVSEMLSSSRKCSWQRCFQHHWRCWRQFPILWTSSDFLLSTHAFHGLTCISCIRLEDVYTLKWLCPLIR